MNGLGTPFLAWVPVVLLSSVCGIGLTATDPTALDRYTDLPVTTIENWPDGPCCAMECPVTLIVSRDGRIQTFVRRRLVGNHRELVRRLLINAERKRDLEHPLQPSEVFVCVRADGGVPWFAVRRVLDACQDPEVRIYKVLFAVRPLRE